MGGGQQRNCAEVRGSVARAGVWGGHSSGHLGPLGVTAAHLADRAFVALSSSLLPLAP